MAAVPPTWAEKLEEICRQRRLPTPVYTMISDRRGGRTAWGVAIDIRDPANPTTVLPFKSRYWYDVAQTDNAKKDAAEVAVQTLLAKYPPLKAIVDAMPARQPVATTPTTVNPTMYRYRPTVPQPGLPAAPGVPNIAGQSGTEHNPGATSQGQPGAEAFTYDPSNPNAPRGQ